KAAAIPPAPAPITSRSGVVLAFTLRCATSAIAPLQEGVWRIGIRVMLELPDHLGPDDDLLHGIAQQVADHADIAGVGQFDQYRQIGAMVGERLMRGMPYPLPAVDAAGGLDLCPRRIEAVAMMAQPFGAELP